MRYLALRIMNFLNGSKYSLYWFTNFWLTNLKEGNVNQILQV